MDRHLTGLQVVACPGLVVSAEGAPEQTEPIELAQLRRQYGRTQAEVAARLGISQSDLSKLERRSDARLSTLRAYAAAVGGRLRLVFHRDGKQVEIRLRDD